MERYLMILLSLLLILSVGTFLLYVPMMTFVTVMAILMGMILLFLLGLLTGMRKSRWPLFRSLHRQFFPFGGNRPGKNLPVGS